VAVADAQTLNFFLLTKNNAVFSNNKKSLSDNMKLLISEMSRNIKKKIRDDDKAGIPLAVSEKYLLPKTKTNLYLFLDSELLGVSKPISYYISPDIFEDEVASFDIDLKKLALSQTAAKDAILSGVLVSVSENETASELTKFEGLKDEIENGKLEKEIISEVKREGIRLIKNERGSSDGCTRWEKYKVDLSYYFKNEKIFVVELSSPQNCGDGTTSFTVIKHDGIVELFKEKQNGAANFGQLFKVNGKRILVIEDHVDTSAYKEIYELKKSGAVLLETLYVDF
jgi:hypothetical protein